MNHQSIKCAIIFKSLRFDNELNKSRNWNCSKVLFYIVYLLSSLWINKFNFLFYTTNMPWYIESTLPVSLRIQHVTWWVFGMLSVICAVSCYLLQQTQSSLYCIPRSIGNTGNSNPLFLREFKEYMLLMKWA